MYKLLARYCGVAGLLIAVPLTVTRGDALSGDDIAVLSFRVDQACAVATQGNPLPYPCNLSHPFHTCCWQRDPIANRWCDNPEGIYGDTSCENEW